MNQEDINILSTLDYKGKIEACKICMQTYDLGLAKAKKYVEKLQGNRLIELQIEKRKKS